MMRVKNREGGVRGTGVTEVTGGGVRGGRGLEDLRGLEGPSVERFQGRSLVCGRGATAATMATSAF